MPASRQRKNTRSNADNYKKNKKDLKKSPLYFVVLFFASLLLLFVVIIPGESVWFAIHKAILGISGFTAILWPLIIGYVSIVSSFKESLRESNIKIYLSLSLVVLVCSATYIFSVHDNVVFKNYFKDLQILYESGKINKSGGVLSGIIGIPLHCLFGTLASRIFIIIAIITNIMLLTGTSIPDIYRFFKKTSQSHKESKEDKSNLKVPDNGSKAKSSLDFINKIKTLNADKSSKSEIDIDLGPSNSSSSESDISGTIDKLKHDLDNKKYEDSSGANEAAEAYAQKLKQEMASSLDNANQSSSNNKSNILEERVDYTFPRIDLLDMPKSSKEEDITKELKTKGQILVDTLQSFGVQAKIVNISRGPAVTRYELQPGAGVKISKITNLADDIALNLAAQGVRIEAPIPGKAAVGIEVPNQHTTIVKMREILESQEFKSSKSKITVGLGRDIAGNVSLADLSKMPHLLIAGSTGSGKSVCINSLIVSILYKARPDEVKLLMVDPKVVELGHYNSIPHLLVPVVTDPRKAAGALAWAVNEMLKRYKLFAEYDVRDLTSYNEMVKKYDGRPPKLLEKTKNGDGDEEQETICLEILPQVVIIIDELADLMMVAPNEVEDSICRLAQMARAAGMHLVIATQRPSVDVITGIIKANIPSRIAFAVSSAIDSRTILDSSGAEKLLGRGDMLFSPIGASKALRIQGCFLTDSEINKVVDFVKEKKPTEYDEEVIQNIEVNAAIESKKGKNNENIEELEDPMFDDAVECVVELGQASTSLLQRKLRLGYARAGRLIDEMEKAGIIGPYEGSKPRKVKITHQQFLEMKLRKKDKD